MRWCLTWWAPGDGAQLLLAAAFWGGLATSGLLLVRSRRHAARGRAWHRDPVDEAAPTGEAAGRSRR